MERRDFLRQGAQTAGTWAALNMIAQQDTQADDARPAIVEFEPDAATGTSRAVRVRGLPLVYTPQWMALDAERRIVGPGDFQRQWETCWSHLEQSLKTAGSDTSRIVRLHVVVASAEVAEQVRPALTGRTGIRPALTIVESRLPQAEALVAIDAVATAGAGPSGERPERRILIPRTIEPCPAQISIAAPRPTLYIAGQAEKGADLRAATRATLAGLKRTLEHLGLSLDHVAQVKSFLAPMRDSAGVVEEIVALFGPERVPPQVYVEWFLPQIEIELVATMPAAAATQETIRFATPPWMTASPIFSRLAIAQSAETLFIGGITGRAGGSGTEQVRDILVELKRISEANGSSLRHLAKATYYVADNDSSAQLNAQRPEFYDPARPPSASKASVQGVGRAGCTISVDMIATPTVEVG